MKTKECPRCQKLLNIEDFSKNKFKKDGCQTYCKKCIKKIDAIYYQNNKAKVDKRNREHNKKYGNKYKQRLRNEVQQYKIKHGCKHCEERDHCALEFHHRNTSTKHGCVSNIVTTGNKKRTWKEIEKCDVVCVNCHRKLHFK